MSRDEGLLMGLGEYGGNSILVFRPAKLGVKRWDSSSEKIVLSLGLESRPLLAASETISLRDQAHQTVDEQAFNPRKLILRLGQ